MNTGSVGRLLGFLLAVLIMIALLSNKVSAAEILDETALSSEQMETTEEIMESEIQESVLDDTEIRQIIEYSLELNQPIETFTITPVPVYEVNPDDYNGSSISTFAMNGSVYSGSYNSTIISLWNGLLSNNLGKDYIAYRASQYEYYIWFGENFKVSGKRFTGTGSYYCLNTYSSTYYLTTGSDSFTIDAGQNYLYTNVSEDYPALETERGLIYAQIQAIGIIALLGFGLLRWIFIGR